MTGTSATCSTEALDASASRSSASSAYVLARARLAAHAAAWRDRPLVRQIYEGYHRAILRARSLVAGVDIEVGAGHGSLGDAVPDILSCDIVPCPWLDCAADAMRLPFREGRVANIIMMDVLHHLAGPQAFFREAERVLAPGGRILLVEPYVSPVSWLAWRFFHHEPVRMNVDPFGTDAGTGQVDAADPWDANAAIPTLIFWRHLARFHQEFPQLTVLRRERFDLLLYPLSGGFEQRRLIPQPLVPVVRWLERRLSPLAFLLAFRCFLVVEKRSLPAAHGQRDHPVVIKEVTRSNDHVTAPRGGRRTMTNKRSY